MRCLTLFTRRKTQSKQAFRLSFADSINKKANNDVNVYTKFVSVKGKIEIQGQTLATIKTFSSFESRRLAQNRLPLFLQLSRIFLFKKFRPRFDVLSVTLQNFGVRRPLSVCTYLTSSIGQYFGSISFYSINS